ncbi:MAG: response regulator [Mariprofundaceae bacterium]
MEILIIDDEAIIENIITAFCDQYAKESVLTINRTCISDPVRALYELVTRGEQFDVVTLDVRMPGLVGDLIFETLMDSHPHLIGKILFVTGYKEDLLWRFPDVDLNVLTKPFNYTKFKKSIEVILAKNVTELRKHGT